MQCVFSSGLTNSAREILLERAAKDVDMISNSTDPKRFAIQTSQEIKGFILKMLFLNIATGVVLVLLGMRYLRKGLGSVEGRRLAIGSLLIKGFGAILILLGSSKFFLFILNILPGAIDRKAANLNHYHPIGHKNSSCALGLEPIYGRLFAESV